MTNVLTCVYCGTAYPEGTPPSGAQVLTDHIKICEKHPLREAEEKIKKLRSALVGLIGVSTKEDLLQMELFFRTAVVPAADKAAAIDAIYALLDDAE